MPSRGASADKALSGQVALSTLVHSSVPCLFALLPFAWKVGLWGLCLPSLHCTGLCRHHCSRLLPSTPSTLRFWWVLHHSFDQISPKHHHQIITTTHQKKITFFSKWSSAHPPLLVQCGCVFLRVARFMALSPVDHGQFAATFLYEAFP